MAMTSTISQPQAAMMGAPTTFVVAVINGAGTAVNIQSMQPVVTRPDGKRFDACNITPISATPQQAKAQVGGNQFNIPVSGNTTSYFSFQVSFFGPAISGGPAQPSMAAIIDCVNSYDDNTTSGSLSPIQLQINQPQFGQGPGSPPNAFVGAPGQAGTMEFQAPANAVFAL